VIVQNLLAEMQYGYLFRNRKGQKNKLFHNNITFFLVYTISY